MSNHNYINRSTQGKQPKKLTLWGTASVEDKGFDEHAIVPKGRRFSWEASLLSSALVLVALSFHFGQVRAVMRIRQGKHNPSNGRSKLETRLLDPWWPARKIPRPNPADNLANVVPSSQTGTLNCPHPIIKKRSRRVKLCLVIATCFASWAIRCATFQQPRSHGLH